MLTVTIKLQIKEIFFIFYTIQNHSVIDGCPVGLTD